MSKYGGEKVLVVKRRLFESIGHFEGFCPEVNRYLPVLLEKQNNFFMDRAEAEEDPNFKQLIPYVVFRCGDRMLHYTRGKSSGEARLHEKGSVGIGGHINPIDVRAKGLVEDTYNIAIARELFEEIRIHSGYNHRAVGLINDESNAVGKVHLGVVHLVDLAGEDVSAKEDAIQNLSFQPLSKLTGEWFERLETWSQLCVTEMASWPDTL